MDKLKSRKFWLTVATSVTALVAAWAGETTWQQAIQTVMAVVLGYQATNAVATFAERK